MDSYKDDNWKFRNALILDRSSLRRLAEFIGRFNRGNRYPNGIRYRLCRLLIPALRD